MLEVLLTVRSVKNAFVPINRIPPDVLCLLPDYCDADEELIKLTHVCRGWREIFVSRASLWTFLDCTDPDKTRVYLERSKKSPLEIWLKEGEYTRNLGDTFLLTVPHTNRFKAVTLSGSPNNILKVTKHFCSPAPLLEKLVIHIRDTQAAPIEITLFGGNLQSLRELRLHEVRTDLPWKNLSNLTTFDLRWVSNTTVTQLLDFFERAPLLSKIKLVDTLLDSSSVPDERVVSLLHLKSLRIDGQPVHSILLNHLHLPTHATLMLGFDFGDENSPLPHRLPRSLDNLDNISHIPCAYLDFRIGIAMGLGGPTGGLYVAGV